MRRSGRSGKDVGQDFVHLRRSQRIDRTIGPVVCLLLTLFEKLRGILGLSRRASERPGTVLIIQISEMGSFVLSHPLLRELNRRFPESRPLLLTFDRNRTILEGLGFIEGSDIIGLSEKGFFAFLWSALKACRRLRRIGIDVSLDLELFSRIGAIMGYLSGAARRVGFERQLMEGLYRGGLLTHGVPYNPYRHIALNFLSLLEAAFGRTGVPLVKSSQKGFDLSLPIRTNDAQADRRADRLLSQACSELRIGEHRVVLLNPGAGLLPLRAWPEENYLELIRRLLRRRDVCVGVVGLASDAPIYERLAARLEDPRFFSLAGLTADAKELIEVFNRCRVLVGGDSGPAQLAALSSIFNVVLFGPETPLLYAPLGRNQSILFAGISCSPCLSAYNHRRSPCDGDNVCLKELTPLVVEEEVVKALESGSPV